MPVKEMTNEDLTETARVLFDRLLCWTDVYMEMESDIAKKSARTRLPTGLIMSSIIDELTNGD